jgi:hypothetical protein
VSREVHVLFDDHGKILAVADAASRTGPDGVILGHRPVERAGQRAVRVALGEEHEAAGPAGLVRDFELDVAASPPRLRRRSKGNDDR